ncbi:hypothetical protein KCP70_02835 [Salmonella enterica subsp. enterica]|nr:hypothetical protein KCP70_02835 [Salmonella enterica subsp. enterica]
MVGTLDWTTNCAGVRRLNMKPALNAGGAFGGLSSKCERRIGFRALATRSADYVCRRRVAFRGSAPNSCADRPCVGGCFPIGSFGCYGGNLACPDAGR